MKNDVGLLKYSSIHFLSLDIEQFFKLGEHCMNDRVTLISMSMLLSSYNIRMVSAALRSAGFHTTKVLLPNIYPYSFIPAYDFAFCYEDSIVNDIARLAQGSLWLGISVSTNLFYRAVDLTTKLKSRLNIPIVWGGVHVNARSEECLQYADYIILGDAEDTVREFSIALASGGHPEEVPGVGYKDNGKMSYSIRPLELQTPLAELPFPDYSLTDEWLQDKEKKRLVPVNHELFSIYDTLGPGVWASWWGPRYLTGASRGCPHRCSYCVNSMLSTRFPEYRKLRTRPWQKMIEEIVLSKEHIPTLHNVFTTDEDFFALGDEYLAGFSRAYKKEVGMHLRVMAGLDTITPERLGNLVEAGLSFIQVGVQSADIKTSNNYRRSWAGSDLFKEKSRLLKKYVPRLQIQYDVLVDNDYETTDQSRKTIFLLSCAPRPFRVETFSLTLFPGSPMYEKALRDGHIYDEKTQIYLKSHIQPRSTYLQMLFGLFNYRIPFFIIRFLAAGFFFRVFEKKGFICLRSGLKKAYRKLIGADSVPVYKVKSHQRITHN